MQQNDIDIIISRYLAGEATDDEIRSLEQWLDSDDANRREFMRQKSLWDAVSLPFDIDDVDIDAAQSRLLDGIEGDIEQPRRGFAYWWARTASVIALPLIVACAALIYMNMSMAEATTDSIQTLRTCYGSTMQSQLPDGSTVWLNVNSSLTYNLDMTKERNVILNGEAYFEVEADKNRPFTVDAPGLSVTATGTAFNVNAYDSDSQTTVTLVNGKVSAMTSDDESLALAPDQQLVFDRQTGASDIYDTDTYKWCAWKDGKLIFRDTPLGDVFKRLAQIYNVDFAIESPGVNNYTCRATFEGENLTEILHLIELSAPISCNITDVSQEQNADDHFTRYHISVSER